MIIIRFKDSETERKAIGYLVDASRGELSRESGCENGLVFGIP